MVSDPIVQTRGLPLLVTRESCAGRTYIVTGANTGLGFEAAKHLVALGAAKVILAVRNTSAGNDAKAKIDSATGTTNVADVWYLDLANYESVKAFATKATTELSRIDGLIENASVASMSEELVNGQNMNISINVIGTFLLAAQLLPKLSETARLHHVLPHLVFVSSRAGFDVEQIWNLIKDDPFVKIQLDGVRQAAYPLSKLIETLIARRFAENLPLSRTGVVLNIVCPGVCVTDLDRNAAPEFREKLAALRDRVGRTAEDGSRTLLHGVVAGKESHGLLLHSCEIGEADVPEWATSEEEKTARDRLWDLVVAELERIEPGCVRALGVPV